MLCVKGVTRHIQVLWGVEKNSIYLLNKLIWEGRVVVFVRYLVEEILTPKVLVKENWCNLDDHQIVSKSAVAMVLLELKPTATVVPEKLP